MHKAHLEHEETGFPVPWTGNLALVAPMCIFSWLFLLHCGYRDGGHPLYKPCCCRQGHGGFCSVFTFLGCLPLNFGSHESSMRKFPHLPPFQGCWLGYRSVLKGSSVTHVLSLPQDANHMQSVSTRGDCMVETISECTSCCFNPKFQAYHRYQESSSEICHHPEVITGC